MDIETIRKIHLADFLAWLGHEPVRRTHNELWYRAPYRNERTPSFRVNVEKQLWYDFGLSRGGDIFTLAGEFLQNGDFLAQAKFIADAANTPFEKRTLPVFKPKPSEPAFENVEVSPLRYSVLTDYLEERGIPEEVALRHCRQLDYTIPGKRYFAIGFPNMAGGYELRNRFFKGCIPPKSISLVKAEDTPADVCSVFEGFMDFLSAVTLGTAEGCDCLVLNSVANVEKAMKHLDGYGRIDCHLDRDEAGHRTLEVLQKCYGNRVNDCSALYNGCKDLNEFLQLSRKNNFKPSKNQVK